MIRIRNLSKKYGENVVFENRSFDLEERKTTAIMGKSGFGKTTLLRILMGLEKYDVGSIEGMENKKISAVFQEDRLCENLSAVLLQAFLYSLKDLYFPVLFLFPAK